MDSMEFLKLETQSNDSFDSFISFNYIDCFILDCI